MKNSVRILYPALIGLLILANCKRKSTSYSYKDYNRDFKSNKLPDNIKRPKDLKSSWGEFTGDSISLTSIENYINANPGLARFKASAKEFYIRRNFEYAWFVPEGVSSQTEVLFNLVNSGQKQTALTQDSINHAYIMVRQDPDQKRAKKRLQELEYNLTFTFFDYAKREWEGNDDRVVKQLEWYIPKKKISYGALLDTVLMKDGDISVPVYNQYEKLKPFLEKHKDIARKGGLPYVTLRKKSLKRGDSSTTVKEIRKALYILGDISNDNGSSTFDVTLESAVIKFQKRHGLEADGKIGKGVVSEINTPVRSRIETILINMERCRWVPFDYKNEYLMVNIPAYKLYAYNENKLQWDMNVVVGKTTNQTIIFNGDLQYIVVNPYWNIPPNIFSKEVLPKLRKNPGWVARNNMEVVLASDPNTVIDPATVDWNIPTENYNKYLVRQKPGTTNALGGIKFLFPNQYNIYLHDTPEKDLFALPNRSFSHGCIRLGEPFKLAEYLLKDEPNWTMSSINKLRESNKEQYITLKKKMPVFIAYFTAWVDEDGNLNFRRDIYGHDQKMGDLILEKEVL